MSGGGGGGFYKFRCKYFYTHECPNWVYVNNTACASCSAQGRDLEPAASQTSNMEYPRQIEIGVPHGHEGAITYTFEIEIAPNEAAGNCLSVEYGADTQAQPQDPTTTSALPGTPVTTTAF
ncbi:hypothetical protein F4801DRAFT_382854 [Xylaria longipes]|nr:hypothetical protein F4801DRAFT_382854 [Xylaria longipes]RYC57884.1 hypothetical protein CHU98_g8325 [Xylaria longipes]